MFLYGHFSLICIVFLFSISRHRFECEGLAFYNVTKSENGTSKEMTMKSYMDETVDPCNDFYKFACGKWPEIHPANGSESNIFNNMQREHDLILGLLLKEYQSERGDEIGIKVKDFQDSCIIFANQIVDNKDEYKKKLRDIIAEVGEMPALYGDGWQADKFDWLETVAKIMSMYYAHPLITLDFSLDLMNNTINRLYVAPQNFQLSSKSIYLDEESASDREIYVNGIVEMLQSYLDFEKNLAQKTAKEIMDFETSLAQGMIDEKLGQNMNDLLTLTTARALSEKYAPNLDIEKLINLTLGIDYNEPIYECVESYFLNLAKVLENTPKSIVANYIFYQLANLFTLTTDIAELEIDKLCLKNTKKIFTKHLENMLYRSLNKTMIYINGHEIKEFWNELKQTFSDEINSKRFVWISNDTREKIIEKLDAMRLEINSYEGQHLTHEFKGLQIDKNDFLGNMKNILKIKSENLFGHIKDPSNFPKPDILDDEIFTYTALYTVFENAVRLPVSQLIPYVLLDSKSPNAVMYGALGYIIAHEVLHGFDDNGRHYDKRGNLKDWWDDASIVSFEDRKMCLIDQYSKYSYAGRKLPRSQLQSENIADNGAIRTAYTMYLRWLEQAIEQGIDLSTETFPAMNYTNKQLFFISFAQIWCSDADPKVFNQQIADTHAPNMVRVLGTLSNFEEFSQEFRCDVGSPMNPINKCELF